MVTKEDVLLGVIVEGHGEEQAAPTLIRRIANNLGIYCAIRCEVRRVPKSQLLQAGELERAIEALTRQIGRGRPLLLLLDADDDCPKDLALKLKTRSATAHSDVRISIVIAKREYEAWFLAAAESLGGKRDLAAHLAAPNDPESTQGAKEWLTEQMLPGRSYSPTRHQAAYSSLIDLSEARRAWSFRKLEKELAWLLKLELA